MGGNPHNAHIFVKEVSNPGRFGVLCEDNKTGRFWIEEKPKEPKSNKAITGLYIYPADVFEVVPLMKPSARGELEITDVNNWFIENKRMAATTLSGFWSDAGTPESLLEVTRWAYGR